MGKTYRTCLVSLNKTGREYSQPLSDDGMDLTEEFEMSELPSWRRDSGSTWLTRLATARLDGTCEIGIILLDTTMKDEHIIEWTCRLRCL